MKPDSTTQTCSPAQHYVNEGAGEKPTWILFAHSGDKQTTHEQERAEFGKVAAEPGVAYKG